MKTGALSLLIVTLIIPFALQANTVAATGDLTAADSCEAYQSKRNQTNPDQTRLKPGTNYTIIEADDTATPGWYRIIVPTAQPRERWVEARCGSVTAAPAAPAAAVRSSAARNSCNQAGLADSHILALSWQPAFCEENRNKKECRREHPASFTLHGLWPNKASCGKEYGYCGEVRDSKGGFCGLKPLALSPRVMKELGEVMPSAAAGGCLERHEWHKHGTCQGTWSVDEYYQHSIRLTREFNRGAISRFMEQNTGKRVKTAQFLTAVDQVLGPDAHKRLQLGCDKGYLVDLYIALPRELPANTPLAELIRQTPEGFKNRCGSSFTIDAAGY